MLAAIERPCLRSILIRFFLIPSMMVVLQACHLESQPPANSDSLKASGRIVLIVPNGFSGALKIVKDSDRGQNIIVQENQMDIRFASNGIVTVKDFNTFEEPHILTAQYSSGKILQVDPEGDFEPGEKALWTIGSLRGTKYPRETMIYLVCAKEEKDKLAAGLR